jgi:hypothetical protein
MESIANESGQKKMTCAEPIRQENSIYAVVADVSGDGLEE